VTVLVDTDVLIDLALNRIPHAAPAGQLLDALEARPGVGCIAWHTLSNFYYLVAPTHGRRSARAFLGELLRFLDVAPGGTESARQAVQLPLKDFEDALQVTAALSVGATVIATRNLRDYRGAPVPALAPGAVAATLRKG
jgi:predicted nucleic acid-binding protein